MMPGTSPQLPENQTDTHEFVNCLASVRCLAELLAENPGLAAGERDQFITIIRNQTDRLVRLLDRMVLPPDAAVSL